MLILPVPTDDAKQSLGIVAQIPRSSIGPAAGPLEMYGYATTPSGEVAAHFAHFLRLEGTNEDFMGLSFAGRFDVPAGKYRLKFLERQAARGFLLPPLFMDGGQGWMEVALRSGDKAGLPTDISLAGTQFVPRTDPSVRPGRRERIVLIAYDPASARDPAVDIDIRAVLADDAGNRYAPGAITVEKVLNGDDGRRSYVLGFTPGDHPPGDYTLRVNLGEANSVLQSYTRLRVLPREAAEAR